MEPKCNYCDFFGEKYHCHNCKIFNNVTHAPQEIDCSLEELVDYINNNEIITERFSIGDYKTIELYTGEQIKIILIDSYKDVLSDGTGYARATFGVFYMDGYYEMNSAKTNGGGWRDSKMRTIYMERIFKVLPEVLRSNIKPVIKKTSQGLSDAEISYTIDKLFAFSEIELCGNNDFSYYDEGELYQYFESERNKKFSRHLWLRSPYRNDSLNFCYVHTSGHVSTASAITGIGVAFGFCV